MFILKYLENSDAACTSEVELLPLKQRRIPKWKLNMRQQSACWAETSFRKNPLTLTKPPAGLPSAKNMPVYRMESTRIVGKSSRTTVSSLEAKTNKWLWTKCDQEAAFRIFLKAASWFVMENVV